jgi:(p)ppGpp synthase/HD superfamily hydrolase
MIAERFGEKVAELVESVTESNKDLPWEERRRDALAHIEIFSEESLLVKSADVIGNTSELMADYEQDGESVWARFNASKEKIITNTSKVVAAILRRWPESPLAEDLRGIVERLDTWYALLDQKEGPRAPE